MVVAETWVSVATDVLAGNEVDLLAAGYDPVTWFRIGGIDPPADAADPMAFPTGIRFTVAGDYDLTMTGVPEPASLALVAVASGLALLRRRRR